VGAERPCCLRMSSFIREVAKYLHLPQETRNGIVQSAVRSQNRVVLARTLGRQISDEFTGDSGKIMQWHSTWANLI